LTGKSYWPSVRISPINMAKPPSQAVTDESVNALHAGLGKCLDQFFRHGSGHDGHSHR